MVNPYTIRQTCKAQNASQNTLLTENNIPYSVNKHARISGKRRGREEKKKEEEEKR